MSGDPTSAELLSELTQLMKLQEPLKPRLLYKYEKLRNLVGNHLAILGFQASEHEQEQALWKIIERAVTDYRSIALTMDVPSAADNIEAEPILVAAAGEVLGFTNSSALRQFYENDTSTLDSRLAITSGKGHTSRGIRLVRAGLWLGKSPKTADRRIEEGAFQGALRLAVYAVITRDEKLRQLAPPQRHRASNVSPTPRHRDPEAVIYEPDNALSAHVLAGTGWIKTLERLYAPAHPLLEYGGAIFPIWAELADEDHWLDLEAAKGELAQTPGPSVEAYSSDYYPAGEPAYWYHQRTKAPDQKENRPTFALDHIEREAPGRFKINARLGRYFDSLVTSEDCDRELMQALADNPERGVGLEELPCRRWAHERSGGDPVFNGTGRSAALSVAATIIFDEGDGAYSALLSRRSAEVATHPHFSHVAPAGIFQPLDPKWNRPSKEFSLEYSILREYGEELFGYKELAGSDDSPVHQLRSIPPVRRLCDAIEHGDVLMRYCGMSVPLLTLRPEVYFLIVIPDAWWDRETDRAHHDDADHRHKFKLNWEYDYAPDAERQALKLDLDENFSPIGGQDLLRPDRMIPHAAAALHLSTQVARRLKETGVLPS